MTLTADPSARAKGRWRSSRTRFTRSRRRHELTLGLHALAIAVGAYVLLARAEDTALPTEFPYLLGAIMGLYVVAHIAVRRLAPGADGTLLPMVAALNGIGLVTITRVSRDVKSADGLVRAQAVWLVVGVGVFVLTLLVVRDLRMLTRYRYVSVLGGVGFLLMPLLPSPIGRTVNGVCLWASVGPVSFQPGEIAKVLLIVFFASYLVDAAELLATATRRIGPIRIPDPRYLAPLLAVWGASILVLVAEKDLGSSLLLFSVFAAMLYVATNRAGYLAVALVLFASSATLAYKMFDHVQTRVAIWHDPWKDASGKGYQIIQSWYAFASGGFSGRGLGLGVPSRIPYVATDFIFAAIGEELGLLGTAAVVLLFLLLVGSGLRIAIEHPRPFPKLFATGISVAIGVQTFVIVGGVTRLIPLTGITLPFVSYGGSSLVANFALIALLARISDDSVAGGRDIT